MFDLGLLLILGNILYLISYLVKDVFMLRVIILMAMFTFIPYYLFNAEEIAWQSLMWSSIFISINVYQLVKVYNERKIIALSEEEAKIYQLGFNAFSIKQFSKLLSGASINTIPANTPLLIEGAVPNKIQFLVSGTVSINNSTDKIINSGSFIGLFNYLREVPYDYGHRTSKASQIITWEKATFEKVLDSDPQLKANWQTLVSRIVAGKL